jgi:hypothetical protein
MDNIWRANSRSVVFGHGVWRKKNGGAFGTAEV